MGMFHITPKGLQEAGALGTVDDTVIATQGNGHGFSRDNDSIFDDGFFLDGAHGQNTGLRLIDDGRKRRNPVHAEVGNGKGAVSVFFRF